MPPTSQGPLQTVDRALQVLLSFNETRSEWGVVDLAHEFDLNPSTAQRLLAALAARGFLVSDPKTRRYRLGPAMWAIASLWERNGGMAALAESYLTTLASVSGRTASFTIPDGFYVRCIAAVDGRQGPVRQHPLVGELYPAHAGATSRAYFAFIDPVVRRKLLSGQPFARYSDLTELDAGRLEDLLATVYQEGWAYSDGEYDPSTRAIAVPVMAGDRPAGSMSLIEPKVNRFHDDIRDHVSLLQEQAAALGAMLATDPHDEPRL